MMSFMNIPEVYSRQGFGLQLGLKSKCALISVDFVNGFVDPNILGSVEIHRAANQAQILLEFFRENKLPVAHTRVVFDEDGANHNEFSTKVTKLKELTEKSHLSQIVDELTPLPGELIVRKQTASAFFATSLSDWLRLNSVDTVMVVGCTTSGCIRATVVDSMQHNFRTVVITDCVADRAQAPHDANLLDMGQKYADLLKMDNAMLAIANLMKA
jgi:maleamate amidohydrolase